MMSRHFRLNSEFSGTIGKRLPHAKNQLSALCSFFNQFYIYVSNELIEETAGRRKLIFGVIITHQNLKIDKFDYFSCDIDYNSRTDVFRDVISLIINQCDHRRLRRTQSVRQPRSANKRSALVVKIYGDYRYSNFMSSFGPPHFYLWFIYVYRYSNFMSSFEPPHFYLWFIYVYK